MELYTNSYRNIALMFILLFSTHDRYVVSGVVLNLQQKPIKSKLLPETRSLLRTRGSWSGHNQSSNSVVQIMKDQIQIAKQLATMPAFANHPKVLRELRFRIKENEKALGASTLDVQLPESAPDKMKALKQTISRAMERHDKCDDRIKRLRLSVIENEDKVIELREENRNLSRLAARTIPKGFHCLALQLTIQYYNNLREGSPLKDRSKVDDNGRLHYVFYTENILAATVVANSIRSSAKEPSRHVFHILTDSINYAAMQVWFQNNTPEGTTVDVKNLENSDVSLFSSGLTKKSENYLKLAMPNSNIKHIDEDVEDFKGLALYYDLPRIFPRLEKVLVLEDDILVQKDLSPLWTEDLNKKVIGAVASCKTSSTKGKVLGWSCINVVDLEAWRSQGIGEILTAEIDLWDALSLLRENNTHELDESVCHAIDLGHTSSEFVNSTRSVAVVHYRGYAKPWLGIGVSKDRSVWARFVDYDNPLLQTCNIHK
ncbi:hypothetical protein KP509_23G085900 [Ceratopteris richardii]|uniref:Hexosyltransferase n=1 Tax=Ceratopteris richardii TaxID=49495 RepID=A0A8T2S1Y9_CERRI|nr:hypothetical protein KP509_23G085900 [Ceratopteris richardii]